MTCERCKRPVCCTAKTRAKCQMKGGECHGGGGCYEVGYGLLEADNTRLRDELEAERAVHYSDDLRLHAEVMTKDFARAVAENTRLATLAAQRFLREGALLDALLAVEQAGTATRDWHAFAASLQGEAREAVRRHQRQLAADLEATSDKPANCQPAVQP